VEITERLLPCSRNVTADRQVRCFLFSRLPHFVFISCAHQTTFRKKKKTYRNVLGATNYGAVSSE
jgi:hypothetical protein